MPKKYILTDETLEWKGCVLHRIKALKNFNNVSAGDLGGWVESENNLSQEGNCWIYDSAKVYDNAQISNDAKIYNNANIYGAAKVRNQAAVYGQAKIFGKAKIDEKAIVYGYAQIGGEALIKGFVHIHGNAKVCGGTKIDGYLDLSTGFISEGYFICQKSIDEALNTQKKKIEKIKKEFSNIHFTEI